MSKPLHCWSLTVAENFKPLCSPERMDEICTEFFTSWCYQGELGDKNLKRHYQCRVISDDKLRKETLLHCLNMRGFDVRDVTFLPESNKSIAQGGLSFYVMDDSKQRFLEMRADPTFTPHRKPDWVPDMCKDVVDNPRPWTTTLIEMLEQPPSHRQVIWICTLGGHGGVQKSLVTAYLDATGRACSIGQGTPIQLQEGVIYAGEHRAYTLDIPKTMAKDNKIDDYINAVEIIKNGLVITAMHGKRKKLQMNIRPHVVVFSNRLPPYESMTEGRFDVYTIDPTADPSHQVLVSAHRVTT